MNDVKEKRQTIYFPVKINVAELLDIEKITSGEDIGEVIKKSISLYGEAKKITTDLSKNAERATPEKDEASKK